MRCIKTAVLAAALTVSSFVQSDSYTAPAYNSEAELLDSMYRIVTVYFKNHPERSYIQVLMNGRNHICTGVYDTYTLGDIDSDTGLAHWTACHENVDDRQSSEMFIITVR